MKNIGNIEHNGRVMYVQVTDTGQAYLSGEPVEHYPRNLQDLAHDLVMSKE